MRRLGPFILLFCLAILLFDYVRLRAFPAAENSPPHPPPADPDQMAGRGQGGPGIGGRGQGGGGGQGSSGGGRSGMGGRQGGQQPPWVAIFDADKDGELSEADVQNATASLLKLDQNKDGKIGGDELRFGGGGGRGSGRGQAGGRGPGGGGRPGGGGERDGDPAEGDAAFAAQVMSLDSNKDGSNDGGQPVNAPTQGRSGAGGGQRSRPRDRVRPRDTEFNEKLPVGSTLPDSLQLYNVDRELVAANSIFKSKYTVLVAGCLTCPEYRNSYPEIEAVAADYRDKGVQFYFLFQSLTHPENWGYVQPTSIQERFAQIEHAEELLQTTIPWLADTMNNEMKQYFAMTPNSQFVFNREGKVLQRASWGRGSSLREWLEELVGPSATMTTVAELNLPPFASQRTSPADMLVDRKFLDGVAVPLKVAAGGEELKAEALLSPDFGESNRYAKLRPEADQQLLATGTGKLYLGFRQDPVLGAAWNNLASPPKYRVTAEGVTLTPAMAEAEKLSVESDSEPREFLLDVRNWEAGKPIKVEIQYFACNKEKGWCKAVDQEFTVWLEQDRTAGMVNGRSHFPGGRGRQGGGQTGRGGGQRGGARPGERGRAGGQ